MGSAIGAWVLETQMYAHEPQFYQQESPRQVRQQQSQHQHIQQQQQQNQYQQQLQQQQQQHLFNQQHKSQPQNQLLHHQQKLQIQQQQQQFEHGQQQYGHNGVYGQYEVALAAPMGQVQQVPELEDPYGYYPGQQGPVVLREPEPTYVDPGRMRQNKGKR